MIDLIHFYQQGLSHICMKQSIINSKKDISMFTSFMISSLVSSVGKQHIQLQSGTDASYNKDRYPVTVWNWVIELYPVQEPVAEVQKPGQQKQRNWICMYSDLFLLKNMEILVKEMNSSKEVNLSIKEHVLTESTSICPFLINILVISLIKSYFKTQQNYYRGFLGLFRTWLHYM